MHIKRIYTNQNNEQELLTNCFITNIFFRGLHLTPKLERLGWLPLCPLLRDALAGFSSHCLAAKLAERAIEQLVQLQHNLTDSTLFSIWASQANKGIGSFLLTRPG